MPGIMREVVKGSDILRCIREAGVASEDVKAVYMSDFYKQGHKETRKVDPRQGQWEVLQLEERQCRRKAWE